MSIHMASADPAVVDPASTGPLPRRPSGGDPLPAPPAPPGPATRRPRWRTSPPAGHHEAHRLPALRLQGGAVPGGAPAGVRPSRRGVRDRILHRGQGAVGARSLLTVAREDPDGFHLLWRHAAREPQFADYESSGNGPSTRPERSWPVRCNPTCTSGPRTIVDYLVEAVLNWLEFGQPARDEEPVALATAGARAGIRAWVSR